MVFQADNNRRRNKPSHRQRILRRSSNRNDHKGQMSRLLPWLQSKFYGHIYQNSLNVIIYFCIMWASFGFNRKFGGGCFTCVGSGGGNKTGTHSAFVLFHYDNNSLLNCCMKLKLHSGYSISHLSTSFPSFSAEWYSTSVCLSTTSVVDEGLQTGHFIKKKRIPIKLWYILRQESVCYFCQ